MAPNFAGKYKQTKIENMDGYLKEIGVGVVKRKLAGTMTPSLEVTQDGDTFRFLQTTAISTTDMKFTVGQKFSTDMAALIDGEFECNYTVSVYGKIVTEAIAVGSWDGDKLVTDITPTTAKSKPQKSVRVMKDENTLVQTMKCGDEAMVRTFTRV